MAVSERRGLSLATRESLAAYLFILPSFLGFAIFLLVPMVMSAGMTVLGSFAISKIVTIEI